MFYLTKFKNVAEYVEFASNGLVAPNVSYIERGGGVFYTPLINCYYNSFDKAINDINNNVIGNNAQESQDDETVCNVRVDSKLNIYILQNVALNQTLLTEQPLNLILNGKTVTNYAKTFIKSNKDITISNGIILCEPQDYASDSYGVLLNGGNCIINDTTITAHTNGGGTKDNPTTIIKVKSGATLNINKCNFNIIGSNSACVSTVYVDENCCLTGTESNFEFTSPNGISATIFSKGDIYLSNCTVNGYANHTANAAGTDYATLSRAIFSVSGNTKLINCQIYGTHSGVTMRNGELYINEGTYEGYSHGGVYLGSNDSNAYIYNASINDAPMRGEGMYDDGVAGTNGAAMYVGGASYMNVYVNNCNFYGKIQPIVIKYSASSSHDNHLYISKSTMNTDYTRCGIRNDGANYVTFGALNTFDYTALENERNYDTTTEIYEIN